MGKSYAKLAAALDTETVIVPDEAHNSAEENKNSQNLYISGDNLDALKHLLKSYNRQVKFIYIDPPYNTGSDDFVYNDKFNFTAEDLAERLNIDDEQAERILSFTAKKNASHSAWLLFMYPRLLLARDLLTEDGVILINIDENEMCNLSLMCDEIFGEANNIGTVIWDKRNPKRDAKGIASQHEYILIYAQNLDVITDTCKIQRPKKNASKILDKADKLFAKLSDTYTIDDINKDFRTWIGRQEDFTKGEQASNKIDEAGYLYRPVSMAWPNKKKAPDDYFTPLIHPITHKPCPVPNRGWRYSTNTMNELLKKGRILFGADETTIPNNKYLLKENMEENIPSLLYYGGSDTDMLESWGILFETAKVVNICKEHIRSFTTSNDIILDFFSGSATTAHAVMQLNAEDGGNRKFIMVQIPASVKENSEAGKAEFATIDQIGMERIKRAAAKIRGEYPDCTADFGFKHYTLCDVPQDTLDKLEQFNPNVLFDEHTIYEKFGTNTILATWLVADGYGFFADVQKLTFDDYTAYWCKNHLYLIEPHVSQDALVSIMDKFAETDFNPQIIVLFGYNFTYTQIDYLKTNVRIFKDTAKNLAVKIDVRY